MCFVLYAGTDKPIPRQEWREESPDISVVSLSERDAPIRAHFSKPEIQYIGSTSHCGCDFPHVTVHNGSWSIYQRDEEPSDSQNRTALVHLLQETGEKIIELYGVWDGDFAQAPKTRENISLQTILHPKFCFKEQGFYTIAVRN